MKLSENLSNQNSHKYLYLYKRMFPFAKPYLFRMIMAFLITIPVGAFDGVITYALKPYTDNVLVNKDFHLAILITLAIPLAALAQGILKYLSSYLSDWVGGKITNDIKKVLFNRLLLFEPEFFDQNESGYVLSRFSADVDTASSGLLNNIKMGTTNFFTTLALICVLIYNSWQLAIIAIVVLGGSMSIIGFTRKRIKYVSEQNVVIGSQIFKSYNETFSGNKIIASYNLQNHQGKTFNDNLDEYFNLKMKLTKLMGWLSPAMYFIASIGISIVICYGSHLISSHQITSGNFVSFIATLLILYRPVKTMGNTFADMQGAFYSMARVFSLFDYETSIKNAKDSIKLESVDQSITLDNVCFEYEENKPVLKNINLTVNKGESLALVGNSGGGKTTIANLIPRFYDIQEGSIKIDDVDIRRISLESLRKNIAVVFQDNFLFTGTIKENILLGKFNATQEEINAALHNAYLDEFIKTLPEGLDTEIGERGVKLSGGQKQRLAIARAMLKNAPIVILDEATSALDNKSEAIVQKALDKLMENKTVIVIAHRLSTIKNAHKIAVINEGKVVEIGTHEELLAIPNGSYKALYDMQFKHSDTENN